MKLVMWCGDSALKMTDADLDRFKSWGVGGWAIQTNYLEGMGGGYFRPGVAVEKLDPLRSKVQIALMKSNFVARCAARGMSVWLGCRITNYNATGSPMVDWFSDAEWNRILPSFANIAGVAKQLGCTGLTFDSEPYHGDAFWQAKYKGNTHTETETRSAVRSRGVQIMQTLVKAFPHIGILSYHSKFPAGIDAKVQATLNHAVNPYVDMVDVNLWDGLTSVPGYGAIRFLESTFYKTPFIGTWDEAISYNKTQQYAYFAQHFSSWAVVKGRVTTAPFVWIDGDVKNEGPFTAPRPPAYVADQLLHCAKGADGGLIGIYCYGNPLAFDYSPYVPGMLAASKVT